MSDVQTPALFRVLVEVGDLEKATAFYSKLLGSSGRAIYGGQRHYYDCGPLIFGLVDVSADHEPHPVPLDYYFAVKDLEAVHARAKALDCLSKTDVHGDSGGEIAVRPWRERSFYAEDPWGNGLCFVDDTTMFTGL